jgi:membrane protein YdbS with pleckstrin-like domain
MTCHECGREVPADAAFCPQCGSRMGGNGDDARAQVAAANSARMFSRGNSRASGNQPAEEDLWSGTYSPQAMIGPAAGLAILTVLAFVGGAFFPPFGIPVAIVVAILLWAIFALVLLYRRMTVHYRLTTFRLFHESGLLNRKRDRIEVIDINDVTLRQGLIERMFNVGTIFIESSDTTDPELHMVGIDNVRAVADLIDNTRRAERQRRAVFMENVGRPPGPV